MRSSHNQAQRVARRLRQATEPTPGWTWRILVCTVFRFEFNNGLAIPALAIALSVGVSGWAPAEAGPTAKPLNIVLISIDTLRADHLGCYGYFRDTSPVIDALAEQSILFENCLSPMATTLPAHTSVFTATYPLEHGILSNIKEDKTRYVRAAGLRTFAEAAAKRGYRTAGFVSAAPLTRSTGTDTGFESFDEPKTRQREAAATNERVLPWLEETDDQPFFLFVHYFDPHYPYISRDPFKGLFTTDEQLEAHIAQRGIPDTIKRFTENSRIEDTRDAINHYDIEIRYVDWQVGLVLNKLKQLGLWDRTALILMSDHGEGFGEHGSVGHGSVPREQIHVPLMMRVPGHEPRRVTAPISLVDLLPTALGRIGGDWSGFLEQGSGSDVLAQDHQTQDLLSQRTANERGDLEGLIYALVSGPWRLVSLSEEPDRLYYWTSDPLELLTVHADTEGGAASRRSGGGELLQVYVERGRELAGEDGPAEAPMDPELLEKLRSLGYVD